MNRIDKKFQDLKITGRTALMPYLTLGYPEKNSAYKVIPALVRAGADLIELGVPFSDPLADGATIQAASQRALTNGLSLNLCLKQARHLREQGTTIPFVLMGYYNPIFQYGLQHFAERAAEAGIDGVIVPDLPPEEAEPLTNALSDYAICPIFLLAPTSDDDRIHKVVSISRGFIYLVSLVGVTGVRNTVSADLSDFVKRVRQVTDIHLAVGFGISTPHQASQVSALADGVIVGSALIKAIGQNDKPEVAAYDFLYGLRKGIDGIES